MSPAQLAPVRFALKIPVPGEPREGWGIISPQTGCVIMSTIRSSEWAAILCFLRDHNMTGRAFRASGYRCEPVSVQVIEKEKTDQ